MSQQHQQQLHLVKSLTQQALCRALRLTPVQAPLFLEGDSGMQDGLSGTERPVAFCPKEAPEREYQVVHSLAKWKRAALGQLAFEAGQGLITDMKAIRADEASTGPLHSLLVEQWDWEQVIHQDERSLAGLRARVEAIYGAFREVDLELSDRLGHEPRLPQHIHFVCSEALRRRYPGLSAKAREDAICRELGAVFLIGIGGELGDGRPHDDRAPDYDDWSSHTELGGGLNGDILIWHPPLGRALELSSMGIRVDAEAMARQFGEAGVPASPWHRALMAGALPQTVGGGIGQGRLAMALLGLEHIEQTQAPRIALAAGLEAVA
ncbi:aspartate--ammonia ligase [Gallaecimonas sp. GXIMD4217]|uniref:aspartate--ammonia ligase n=1 Tax=Gallaecimonas sp. GXIMD4217 TaxID=3131927 RepID=UPI00311ACBA0